MIRYLSCTHNNYEQRLTKKEMKIFKEGKAVIVTENNQTRFEECKVEPVKYGKGIRVKV